MSAVVMAGYNNKRAVKKYSKIVAENYGERFIETGYKPLREFTYNKNGVQISKPVIQFTLEKLAKCEFIDDVVITGHQMLLEQSLGEFLKSFEKPCEIVNQNTKIPSPILKHFKVSSRKVNHNSIAGNFVKGYAATKAYKEQKHVLVIACDSPLTTIEFIREFSILAQKESEQSALIFPAVTIGCNKDKLGRRPFLLLNDSDYHVDTQKDKYGRVGFRFSSILYSNPHLFDIGSIESAYNLRKLLNPKIQMKILKITRSLGYPNIYSKYFVKKTLSVKECGEISSLFLKGKVTAIPINGESSTYDYDGTQEEYNKITEMLNRA